MSPRAAPFSFHPAGTVRPLTRLAPVATGEGVSRRRTPNFVLCASIAHCLLHVYLSMYSTCLSASCTAIQPCAIGGDDPARQPPVPRGGGGGAEANRCRGADEPRPSHGSGQRGERECT